MMQPRLVGERYELGELIGYGGMAEVHRGRDVRLNREVAIKILRADLARDPSFLNRFRREAHSAAGLNHPSIVSVYDTGEDTMPDGATQPFIVMEFVEGRTLRDIVKSEGSLPAARAMEITADICAALDFSHRNGIIHRDIKPANVMITPQGAVKVMDFGIARAVADNSATQTQTANVIGTAQYLSPEQARGETVDARSDVYSTGCLLYELITGGPPFQGDSPVAVAYQHVRENPVMPSARKPGVPRVLDSIVMKALAKNQLNRYQSAGDMRSDLQRALADQPVTAEAVMTDAERTQFIARTPPPVAVPRREDYVPPVQDDSRRTGLIWAAVVVALLLVIGIGAFFILKGGSGSSNQTAVPDVVGMSQAEAMRTLSADHFNVLTGAATSGPCDGGQSVQTDQVCKINPPAGTKLAANQNVTIQLYQKAAVKSINIPSVVGESKDQATADLVKAGVAKQDITYRPKNELDTNGNATPNEVLAQNPLSYTVQPIGTKVILNVATGKIVLPSVKGLTYDAAQTKINTAGFTQPIAMGKAITTSDQSKNGTVAQQSPTGNIAYSPSQTVTLTLYQYVMPQPSCMPAPATSTAPVTPPVTPPGTGTPTTGASTGSTLPICQSTS